MSSIRVLGALLLSNLFLASAYSQAPTPAPQTPPASGEQTQPSAASSPHQRDVTGAANAESPPVQNSSPEAASSPHQHKATRMASAAITPGMKVEDGEGKVLGTVAELTPATQAADRFVVIKRADGTLQPVPYSVASTAAKQGKILIGRESLEQAPKVSQSEIDSGTEWQQPTKKYWSQ